MERDYLDIIKEKEFIALNDAEREKLAEVCATEEEFNEMKAVLLKIDSVAAEPIIPNAKTKESLDSLFAQTYPKASPIWYNSILAVIMPKEKPIYRQPMVQIAAAFLIFWMVFPFFNDSLLKENKQVAKIEMKEVAKPLEAEVEEVSVAEDEREVESITIDREFNGQGSITTEAPGRTRSLAESASFMTAMDSELIEVESSLDEFEAEESVHPDGIFMGGTERSVAFAQSAHDSQDLLDLLTPTF